MWKTSLLGVVALATAGLSCARPSHPAADVVITHANIWSGDAATPGANAIAIIGERIVAVGGAAEIESWRGAGTREIDAGGRRVVPGFNDAHVHFVDGGSQLDYLDLKDAATAQEFVAEDRRTGEDAAGGRVDARRQLGRSELDAGAAAYERDDRFADPVDAGVPESVRRARGAGEFARAEAGRR